MANLTHLQAAALDRMTRLDIIREKQYTILGKLLANAWSTQDANAELDILRKELEVIRAEQDVAEMGLVPASC